MSVESASARVARLALAIAIAAPSAALALDVAPLWNFNDPAASERAFREALGRTAEGSDDALVLQTQLARTFSLRARFADAHALLDAVAPRLATAGPEPNVRFLLERGRTFRSAKEPARARPLFEDAAARAHAAGLDALEVDALHMVALVEPGTEPQLGWNRRALAVARASAEPAAQRWEASLQNNIGWTLADAGRNAEALPVFQAAAAARTRTGPPGAVREARWAVARTLRALGRNEEALGLLRMIEREADAANDADGYVFEELGENLLATGRAAEARPWFGKAHALLSVDTSPDRPDAARLARLAALAAAP